MLDLNDLVDVDFGWSFRRAMGINDSGQIAVEAFDGSSINGFLLTPNDSVEVSEPTGLALLLASLGARCHA